MSNSWEPHKPFHVENTWNEFVVSIGGQCISNMISKAPNFANADYLFADHNVVAELKEIETDFAETSGVLKRFSDLFTKLIEKEPSWKPLLFGGDGTYPDWYHEEYISILQRPLARILKKANSQIKSTKKHFDIPDAQGVLIFVNDAFISYSPDFVRTIVSDVLTRSYSSIDCFIYLTANRYVDIPGSDLAHLVWAPLYSEKANDSLVDFINDLGRAWFKYIEKKIGPFDGGIESESSNILDGARSIGHDL